MAEDLANYNLQLQQVEAALLTDPENDELLKLKADLEEVIELTKDLITTQESESSQTLHSSSNDDDVTATLLAAEQSVFSERKVQFNWRIGEKCLAKWRADDMFYEAVIEEINDDHLKVKFDGYNTLETITLNNVKKLVAGVKRSSSGDESKPGKGAYNREYLKKKKQKKQQRFKQIEEERETEKNKWLNFKTKALKKPGVKGKSIFASPETLAGRVGIGTCGISGKPMTEYTPGEKWKKGGEFSKTNTIKYLEVMVGESLKWAEHMSMIAGRTRQLITIFTKSLRDVADHVLLKRVYISQCLILHQLIGGHSQDTDNANVGASVESPS